MAAIFRRLTFDNTPPFKLRETASVTLILVRASGEAHYGRTRADKDEIVLAFNEGSDLLLWPWAGQYHTDVFELTGKDLQLLYR